jgi:hypothetical protein
MAQEHGLYSKPTREEIALDIYRRDVASGIGLRTLQQIAELSFDAADAFIAEREKQRASEPLIDDARALALAESERSVAREERDALSDVLREIHAELDGTEWESATCQSIADRLREIGYTVRDVETAALEGGAS